MKILSSSQLQKADKFTIENEPIPSIQLMERASARCTDKITSLFPDVSAFTVFCGTGNNGGDGLAIARMLQHLEKNVTVYVIHFSNKLSSDNETNLKALLSLDDVIIVHIKDSSDLPVKQLNGVVIDALVGTGLTRPLSGLLLDAALCINKLSSTVVSIDLPSGLYADVDCTNSLNAIVKADYTLSFQAPKLNFFFPSTHEFVGDWIILDIGLDVNYINSLETRAYLCDEQLIASLLKTRDSFAHKGKYGHALIVAGSHNKMGAAILSSTACLRAGAGLVTAFVPKCGYEIMQTSVPEAMTLNSDSEDHIEGAVDLSLYSTIGVGPGIGTHETTKIFLKNTMVKSNAPMVIDADALNLLADKALLSLVPKNAILTPHLKEFQRVFGDTNSCFERLSHQRKMSQKHELYILLKGKNSSLSCPNGDVYFNNTGNPGMATAGSGDVLTGIITGLLSQGYTSFESAVLGMHIHGLAGDFAANAVSEEGMIASDIIKELGQAFKRAHLYE